MMRRLVFLTLSLTRGGAERVICNMCNEYFIKQDQVTIISLMAAEPEYELHPGIRVLSIDQTPEQYRQNLAGRFIRRRTSLARTLKRIEREEGKIDALISFLPEPNFLITSLHHKCDYPVIISVRNDPEKEYHSVVRQFMMRMLYPHADGYVFQTMQAKEYFSFSKHITEHSTVIPNPLGRSFLGVEQSKARRTEIAVVGRLEEQKDPLCMIEAFAKLYKSFPEYRLCFYGEGRLRAKMQEEIRRLGMEERILLKGNITQVPEVGRDAAVYVLCSRYEGMPNALMEAMAMGLPCVATDCPCKGPQFLIRPGENGLLVPVGDADRLADAIRYLLEHPEEAEHMGQNAQKITEQLDPDTIYRKWDQFMERRRICAESQDLSIKQ